jgi:nicotinamidase-related amidase
MGYGLMLVDVQRNLLEGDAAVAGAAELRRVLGRLLGAARAAAIPIVHVENDGDPGDPDEPGTPGWELVFAPEPGEPVVRKDTPDAFLSNPALADVLHAMGVDTLVVAGLQSELCVQATALGARERGFAVVVPADAHTTFDGEQTADEIAARVARELSAAGVEVPASAEAVFA